MGKSTTSMAVSHSNPSATRLHRLAVACFAIAAATGLGGFRDFPDPLHLGLGASGATLAIGLGLALRVLARQAIELQERSDFIANRSEANLTESELDTDRRRLEDLVQERELKYSVLFDSGSDAIFVTEIQEGQALRFVEANAVACRRLGYTRPEILELDPLDLCPVQDRSAFEGSLRDPGGREGSRLETTLLDSSGRSIPVEISARLLEWQGRRWTLSIARDITDSKKSEGELREAISRAESASRVKSEFLANMSHEIRTPLNAVIGFSELLAGTDCRPEQASFIASIRASSRNLLRLINDILDMSKMEAGRMRLATAPTDLRHLFGELVRMFGAQVAEKRIELRVAVPDALPRMVSVDETRLRQILVNLVGNAIKFTHRGEVRIEARSQGSNFEANRIDLQVSVVDTGIGIDPEEQELVFDAFEQSHRSLASGGTGLGLAISRKLARLMGGDIRLESHPGRGSTFTLHLPDLEVVPVLEEAPPPSDDLGNVHFRGGRVLVVDDLDVNRMLMREILQLTGLECMEAENGEIAIQLAEQSPPDLILMDLRMPVMDGWEATRRLRSGETTRNIPVVALTASIDRRKSPDLERLGFDGFLSKPVEVPHLVKTLDRWFARLETVPAPDRAPGESAQAHPEEAIESIRPLLDAFREKSENGMHFGDVRFLSQAIAQAAEESGSPALAALAERLAQASRTFDLRAIERLLDQLGRNT
ncbi:MAG TPA: ATP-binding protein [Fibrobacteria bacterium]|nr:ATP-binding protein [Fibrobacteria bacterium]